MSSISFQVVRALGSGLAALGLCGPAAALDLASPEGQAALQARDRQAVSQANAEKRLQTARAGGADLEEALADNYKEVQLLCDKQFDILRADAARYAKAEARTNVIGSVVALIGSVTAYAPGKTVLMGLGISSAGDGKVASGLTQFFSTKASADRNTLESLQTQYTLVIDRYESVTPEQDNKGGRRAGLLARARGICMGLHVGVPATAPKAEDATPPEAKASEPAAKASGSGG